MTDLHSLLTRVEAAAGPDRELDADIDVALFGGETIWLTANYTMKQYPASRRPSASHIRGYANEHVPLVTASLDAALALVLKMLPGCNGSLAFGEPYRNPIARLAPLCESGRLPVEGGGAILPLAVLYALLRALIAKQEVEDA